MILLVANNETLRLTTSSTSQIDVVVSYIDHSSNGFHPSASHAQITSAATTQLVASPPSSRHRQIKQITIRNAGVTSNTVVLVKQVSSTVYELFPDVALAGGEALVYHDGVGFTVLTAGGLPKTTQSLNAQSPTVNTLNVVVLNADVTNSNVTANTLQDVTGLSFPVVNGGTYWFRFECDYTAVLTSTGSRWTINGPAASRISYRSVYSLTTTSNTYNAVTAYQLPAASNATSANTGGNQATVEGHVVPSADGTIQLQFASEVSGSAIVAKAGSICQWMRVI